MRIHWFPLQQQADTDLNGKGEERLTTHLGPPETEFQQGNEF